jgi:hypothetical protein
MVVLDALLLGAGGGLAVGNSISVTRLLLVDLLYVLLMEHQSQENYIVCFGRLSPY